MKYITLLFLIILTTQLLYSQNKVEPIIIDDTVQLVEYYPGGNANTSRLAILKEGSTLKISENLPVLDGATALYPV